MESKLTIKLKKKTLEKGKAFAIKQKSSLSRLIENYLDQVTRKIEEPEISPLVKSLSGVVKKRHNNKQSYTQYLLKKYR